MPSEIGFAYVAEHPVIEQPDGDSLVWRYLGLAELLALLGKKQLHFGRLDSFEDPFEGTWPKVHVDAEREVRQLIQPSHRHELGRDGAAVAIREKEYWAASCWHLSECESDAMWRLYAKHGVAIQSTFARLTECLPKEVDGTARQQPIYVGKVQHLDFACDTARPIRGGDGQPRWSNAMIPVMHKRRSFEHEHEVRAVTMILGDGMDSVGTSEMLKSGVPPEGLLVPVDVETLVEQVYVSPTRPPWFTDVVQDAITRYGLMRDVRQSSLAMQPYF